MLLYNLGEVYLHDHWSRICTIATKLLVRILKLASNQTLNRGKEVVSISLQGSGTSGAETSTVPLYHLLQYQVQPDYSISWLGPDLLRYDNP